MTLAELNNIKYCLQDLVKYDQELILNDYQNSESKKQTNEALRIINREINLKTMNPVKSKEDDQVRCSCDRGELGLYVVNSNPNCREHGISQQLNKSQME